jgi:hypothetical protein
MGAKQQEKSPEYWIATAEYSSAPLSQQQKDAQQFENPLDRPSKIRWNTAHYNKPLAFDNQGLPVLMSSGEPVDPPPEADRSRWVVNVAKNVAGVPNYILDYTDGVNASAFTIQGLTIPQYVAKIADIEIGEEQTAQVSDQQWVTYYPFAYAFELRPETWKLKLLDQGFWQLDPNDSTKRKRIQDDSTPPRDVVKPWLLDGSGGRVDDPSIQNSKYLVFDAYNYVDYGVLPAVNGNP